MRFAPFAVKAGRAPDGFIPLLLLLGFLLASAGWQPAAAQSTTGPAGPAAVGPDYVLGSGDRLRVTVFGHEDLSGEFEVGANDRVSLPLIGELTATGLTLQEMEKVIVDKLSPEYLKNPQVSIQVLNYRPFYILGEVNQPGSYPYVNGMRVINAVALAGGYTYRADEDDLLITRADGSREEATPTTEVYPGDVIEVPERFF